jgi:hypothetical protein
MFWRARSPLSLGRRVGKKQKTKKQKQKGFLDPSTVPFCFSFSILLPSCPHSWMAASISSPTPPAGRKHDMLDVVVMIPFFP